MCQAPIPKSGILEKKVSLEHHYSLISFNPTPDNRFWEIMDSSIILDVVLLVFLLIYLPSNCHLFIPIYLPRYLSR